MAAELPRTELALADCRMHLKHVAALDPEFDVSAVEAYLTRHIAVQLCAEVEATLTSYVDERVDAGGCDAEVANLVKSLKRGAARSAKHGDIAEVMGRFGHDFRTKYEALVSAVVGDEGVARLGNAVGVRDQAAHVIPPPAITFRELELATEAAKQVLQCVRSALSLP